MAVKGSKDFWFIALLIVVVLMGVEIVYLVYQNQQLQSIIKDPTKYFTTVAEKQTVPSITVLDIDGNDIYLRYSPEGPFTVLFWFSPGCSVCDQNYPFWEKIYTETPHDRIRFYGMCVGYPDEAEAYVREHDLPFPVVSVTEPFILEQYGGNLLPQTMLIAPEGIVLDSWPGLLEKDQEDKILSFLKQFNP